jgi:phosphate transport system substrate-binding protein
MSSRELKDTEKPLNVFRMAKDGIAIVVQKDNPVKGLTMAQVKDIYMGKIKNWKDVGGNDAAINLYTRESTSGTRGGFEELVLGKDAAGKQIVIDEKICAAVLNSTGDLAAAVGKDKNAIGYMSLGVVPNYADDKALDLDSVAATTANVANGTYKLQRDFLLLTKAEPTGVIKDFIDYATTSPDAIAYMNKNGLVPIAK